MGSRAASASGRTVPDCTATGGGEAGVLELFALPHALVCADGEIAVANTAWRSQFVEARSLVEWAGRLIGDGADGVRRLIADFAAVAFGAVPGALVEIGTSDVAPRRWHRVALSAGKSDAGGDGRSVVVSWYLVDAPGHQERLEFLASHDPLTGLANRATVLSRLQAALERRDRRPGDVAVLFVDLDGFKAVNDRFGHGCGDEVLMRAAQRLAAVLGPGDVLGRFGGDEFVAVTTESHAYGGADALADRLRSALADPFAVAGQRVSVGASVGVAEDLGHEEATELVARADSAMYAAKRTRLRRPDGRPALGHGPAADIDLRDGGRRLSGALGR